MKELSLSWGMLVLSVLFNVCGIFVIKMRLNELGPLPFDSVKAVLSYFLLLLKAPLVIGGVILFFIAPFLFAVALSRMEIAVAYPAQIGLNFLFLILLALLVLGEPMTPFKGIGMVLILIGIYFLNK